MRKTYLSYNEDLRSHFAGVRVTGDARLFAALNSMYFLWEAEQEGKFYLIFDYHPTLPATEEERIALPRDVLDTTFAVLEFDEEAERVQEIEAIRRSLWGDDDNGAATPARLKPVPPARSARNARRPPAADERFDE